MPLWPGMCCLGSVAQRDVSVRGGATSIALTGVLWICSRTYERPGTTMISSLTIRLTDERSMKLT